ncbi:MAG TPA: phosphatase PAP2 family protein [Patescibacteria group bacterium]|nr:phosphatase PAP2 family protein [Patescibacteria group bacterium]
MPSNIVSTYRFQLSLWTILLFIIYKYHPNGILIVAAGLFAVLIHFIVDEGIIKHVFKKYCFRVRPYNISPDDKIAPIGFHQQDSSFPSSHMSITLAALTVCFPFFKQYWPLMLVYVLFLAFARLHKGLHYPTDELAGILLGMIYGGVALLLVM